MDGVEALRHLREWLGKEAGLPLELLTGLEKVLAEEQVFQVTLDNFRAKFDSDVRFSFVLSKS